jgi:CRISPR-associated protein Csx17
VPKRAALEWLDAAYVLTDDGAKYPPLLGTGGNDGRLEFTNNFMQRLTEVIDAGTGDPMANSAQRLAVSLFAEGVSIPPTKAPIGQFLPGTAGGANATSGFDSASFVNPWDFILMIEGALLFAAASVKRLESGDTGALAYPFCVRQAGVGYASSTSADESASRAEMWLPVWTQRAVNLSELRAVFSEGRAQVGGRAARNGVDFARAVVGMGVERGLDEFQRYGFQVRNGLSYFATPLTRITTRKNAGVDLLSDVDVWLDRYRRAATKDGAPASVRRTLSVLEARIMDLCVSHTKDRVLAVFVALGQCQAAAARSLKWATDPKTYLMPLQGLRKEWLEHGWHRPEFRLAASLASIRGKFGKEWLTLRCHLEQVETFRKENSTICRWAENPSNNVQWSAAPLPDVLNDILARRLILTEDPPHSRSEVWASQADIKSFIEGETDDALLSDLLWSMSLINWGEKGGLPSHQPERVVPPTLYAILKLCFPPVQRELPASIRPVPAVPAIHRHAANGNGTEASGLALRRLRASGYRPLIRQLPVQGASASRTAAALLFPISNHTLEDICKQTTRPEKEAETASD